MPNSNFLDFLTPRRKGIAEGAAGCNSLKGPSLRLSVVQYLTFTAKTSGKSVFLALSFYDLKLINAFVKWSCKTSSWEIWDTNSRSRSDLGIGSFVCTSHKPASMKPCCVSGDLFWATIHLFTQETWGKGKKCKVYIIVRVRYDRV